MYLNIETRMDKPKSSVSVIRGIALQLSFREHVLAYTKSLKSANQALGIQHVSNPSIRNQRISTQAHYCYKSERKLILC